MRIAITMIGPGTDRWGFFQIPGGPILFFFVRNGVWRTWRCDNFIEDAERVLAENGVDA